MHYWLDWDWPAAEASFRKAIAVDPGYSQAYRVLGIVLAYLGRHDEAREAMRHARELEPLAPMELALYAHVAFAARDFKSALSLQNRQPASMSGSGLASSSSPRCTCSWATMNRRSEPSRSPSGTVKPTAR